MTLRALQDLFQRHRDRATGHWKLSGEGGRTLFLESGDVVFATSGRVQDRITSLLVERGKLTQVQLDYAMANLKPGLSVGRNLIDMGYITQRDLLDVARLQVERVVYGSLEVQDEAPTFEDRELDASTVRLPLDTPQLLLNGILELKDREGLLELIGPLNQVVVLEGRKHLALNLPADLAKLPPHFDGTRTLLELGREVSVETLRLGIFALFLREMGWARLHELPPLDQRALDLAIAPEVLAMSQPLPEPSDPELPNLFAAIRDAERPTTNLEHLSQSLDDLLETAPMPSFPPAVVGATESEFEPFLDEIPEPVLEEGQVSMPTPAFELPEFTDEPGDRESEPSLTLQPDSFPITDACFDSASAQLDPPSAEPRRWLLPVLLGGVAVIALGAFLVLRHRGSTKQPPAVSAPSAGVPVVPPVVNPEPKPATAADPSAQDTTPAVEPSKEAAPALKPEPKPEPTPAKPAPVVKPESAKPSPVARPERKDLSGLEAIRRGELQEAVKIGEGLAKGASKQWCVRLMLATQVETVQKAPGHFEEKAPALFLLPFRFRDGRTSYQVMFGPFADRTSAESHLRSLPPAFRAGGNRPILFKVAEVPRKQ